MAAYSHIYLNMYHFGTHQVYETNSWYIYSQEAGACYTGMVQHYPTSLQRAVAPIELPRHSDNKTEPSSIQVTRQP